MSCKHENFTCHLSQRPSFWITLYTSLRFLRIVGLHIFCAMWVLHLLILQEQAEEEGEEDLLNKRRAMGTDEVQRIVWRICAILSSGGVASAETSKPSLVVPENRQDETIEELRQQLRRRRKKHLAYCIAQRNMIEGSSKSALAILQSETIQGLSDTSEAIEKFSRSAQLMIWGICISALLQQCICTRTIYATVLSLLGALPQWRQQIPLQQFCKSWKKLSKSWTRPLRKFRRNRRYALHLLFVALY